jgi:uncharacterized protein (TIGR02118 family)
MPNRRVFVFGVATSLGAMTLMSAATPAAAAPGQPVSFNVIYPNHEGARFDTNYYRSSHIPLVRRVMNPTSVVLIEGVPRGASAPPYVMIAHMEFSSSEALEAALANPAMAEVRADVARFTDIKQTIMFGKP